MHNWLLWLHSIAGIYWLGGMTLMLWAVRPAAIGQLEPAERLAFMAAVLRRFFIGVWWAIALLVSTGVAMFASVSAASVPRGWHAMAGAGILMTAIFAHLYFAPWRRLRQALAAQDRPAAARALGQIHPLVVINCALGWLAVSAVQLWR